MLDVALDVAVRLRRIAQQGTMHVAPVIGELPPRQIGAPLVKAQQNNHAESSLLAIDEGVRRKANQGPPVGFSRAVPLQKRVGGDHVQVAHCALYRIVQAMGAGTRNLTDPSDSRATQLHSVANLSSHFDARFEWRRLACSTR